MKECWMWFLLCKGEKKTETIKGKCATYAHSDSSVNFS